MNREEVIIRTENLTKVYTNGKPVRALDGVNLEVRQGEMVAVTGPSGSGKSTLINLVGTLDRPSEGSIVVDGVDVSMLRGNSLADFRRARIGFVFQLFHLVPTLTALENVMLPLIPYRRGLQFSLEERARELLELIGLADRRDHLPSELSGGEMQRVAIARALVNQPSIVLADEPTGNLDSNTGAVIVSLLHELKTQRGVAVVLATHNRELASRADRVVALQDGRLA